MEQTIQDYFNGLCCTEPALPYNFDVESSDWASVGITDQATFNSVLGVTTGAFAITGNKIEAEILTMVGSVLDLGDKKITNVNYITNIAGLLQIQLRYNLFTEFNPTKPLPNTLTNLRLNNNALTFFNPSIPLPITLSAVTIDYNEIDIAGYTTSETWANAQPAFTNNCEITFSNNIDSVSGTNLETILLTKNTTIIP